MKLIVGLGNPGKEYKKTRHNVGFLILDHYLGNVKWKNKFNSLYYETEIGMEKVIFVKPETFMNLSGTAISEFVNYFKIDIDDILIIHDDLDQLKGNYKLKRNSGSGGNNGINSIIKSLKTETFLRLKIGISSNKNFDAKNYVLGRFTLSDNKWLKQIYEIAGKIIESFVLNGIEQTMHIYNTKE